MSRVWRSLFVFVLLTGGAVLGNSALGLRPPGVSAAEHTALLLQPTLLVAQAAAGEHAGLFVHAPAFTQLRLSLTYPGGVSSRFAGKTDGQGRYVFTWILPADLRQSGTARLQLTAQRGGLYRTWLGTMPVRKALAPPLFVSPLAARVLAGTNVRIFVGTKPMAPISYRLAVQGGASIARGTARADSDGRYVLSVRDRYLPQHAVIVLATFTISTPAGSRTDSTQVTLLPRPPLPLAVTLAHMAVHAGQPLIVQVSSAPRTRVKLDVVLGDKVLARGSGITDASGRWIFTTAIDVSPARAKAAHIVVQASHGIDRAGDQTTFLLQPGQVGIVDRLANAGNPTPDLSHYFTTIPDKVIMVTVATSGQTLRAYENGVLVHEDYVTTGEPALPTPPGTYQVMAKYSPYEMISPWPASSPFYYPPSWTHFAMLFRDGGYFLHDAPWRSVYGPGTNLPHASDPGEPIGTHGCVNLPYPDMVWLWNWTPIGTTVVVY